MKYSEQAVSFVCQQESLVGILAVPAAATGSVGVVVIVGGPQYRAGSHRQFVLLSRALAAAGYPVLRFDYRGMGDSTGEKRNFSDVSPDVAAAIDAMQSALPTVKKVALWGLCDGASAALLYCRETNDARVSGQCLLNPWVRSEATLARTQVKHYYSQRLMQKEFWLKLLRGEVALAALSGFAKKIRMSASRSRQSALQEQPFQQRMAVAWQRFPGEILLILSGEDYTAKEFIEYTRGDADWKNCLRRASLLRQDVPGVDHTFSGATSRRLAEDLTIDWLARQCNVGQAISVSASKPQSFDI